MRLSYGNTVANNESGSRAQRVLEEEQSRWGYDQPAAGEDEARRSSVAAARVWGTVGNG